MTHEQSNKISSIIDALEDEYILIDNLLKYEHFIGTQEKCLKGALSGLNGVIEMLYVVKDE